MKAPRYHDKGPLTVLLVLAAALFVGAIVFQGVWSSKARRVVRLTIPYSPSGESKPQLDVYRMPTAGATVN
jgi:hypothetical protein